MRREPWRVKLEPDVEKAFRKIRNEEPRGIEAIDGFLRFVQRAPLDGFAVPRMPGVLSRPFHTGQASYLVIYQVENRPCRQDADLAVGSDAGPVLSRGDIRDPQDVRRRLRNSLAMATDPVPDDEGRQGKVVLEELQGEPRVSAEEGRGLR